MRLWNTLQGKLFIAYSLVMIIITLCVSVPIYMHLKKGIEANIEGTMNDTVSSLATRFNETAAEFDNISKELYLSSDNQGKTAIAYIQDLFYDNAAYDTFQAKRAIQNFVAILPEIHSRIYRLSIVTRNGEIYSNLPANLGVEHAPIPFDFDAVQPSNGEALVRHEPNDYWLDGDKEAVFVYSRLLDPKVNQIGLIEMQVRATELLPADELSRIEGSRIDILQGDYSLFSTSSRPDEGKSGLLEFSHSSERTGLTIRLTVPERVAFAPIYVFRQGAIAAVSILILFSVTVFFLLSRLLTHPLLILRRAIDAIELGGTRSELENTFRMEEIELLNRAFRRMDDRLRISLEETVRFRTLQLQSHFDTLQAQMNPHFLFNMLGAIHASAESNQVEQIQYISRNMADLLRYSITADSPVTTLDKELEFTVKYLELMRTRYLHRLSFTVDVDPSLHYMLIPKLTLQPLVENCLQHGFGTDGRPLHITLSGRIDDDRWELRVADDGSGFSEEKLLNVQEKIDQYAETVQENARHRTLAIGGMGLTSTIARLKYMFKELFHYRIENLSDGGAAIVLTGSMKQ